MTSGLAAAVSALLLALAGAVAPPADLTLADWSEGRIVIPAEANTARPGPLSWDGFEYCIEPLEKLSYFNAASRVTIMAAAQTGKSNIGVVWVGWTICQAPRPMGLAVPSGPKAASFNSKKLQPVIDKTPDLRRLVVAPGSRDERASTTRQKNYPGGSLTIFSAGSVNDLQSESFGAVWLTETPNFLADIAGRGSPVTQVRSRMDGWEAVGTKELHESTPGEEGQCPISADFEAGDQRHIFLPCPQCDRSTRIEWEDFVVPDDPNAAPYVAMACCGYPLQEHELAALKRRILRADDPDADAGYLPVFPSKDPANPAPGHHVAKADFARWRARDCEGREPSYHFWQVLSPLKTWRGLAKDWRDAKGKPAEEASFRQQKLGLPTAPAAKAPDHSLLVAAAAKFATPRGQVPFGTCYLTGAADIQGDRIEWAVYAHGPSFMARIDRGVIDKDPLDVHAWHDLAEVTKRRWEGPHTRPLGLDVFGVDSGGVDGVTPRTYEFTHGRNNVYAVKGTSGAIANGLPVEFKRLKAKDTRERTISVEFLRVDGYIIKRFVTLGLSALAKGAEMDPPTIQPSAILFEDDATEEDFKQLTAEVFKRPVGARIGERGEWLRVDGRANEQLDLAVYAWALAYQKRIHTWDQARWEQEFARRARVTDQPMAGLEALWSEPAPVADLAVNPGGETVSLFSGRKKL
jgi:phage terminase large subunit GpA-like protein